PYFREVLEPKLFIKAHRSLQSLGLFFLNQVISEESTKLITWKQIKFIRGKSCKGNAATWFSSIEKKYPTNPSNREISEGLSTYNSNNTSIMPNKADIKEDNRIKDWVLIEERENSITIKWKDKTEQVLEKCSGCELNSNKGKENVVNQKVLSVPKEVITKKKMGNVEALASNLLDPQLTVEASLANI
ncbi:12162_t:CDS:2, partial [Gigaspora margarita]